MSMFEVTSSELRSKAEALLNLNSQFAAGKSDLEGKEGALISMWEGEAKRLFHDAFLRDCEQMDVFKALIEEYVNALLEIAQRYEEAEKRNAELASARSY